MPVPTIYTDSLRNSDTANAAGRAADILRELPAAGGNTLVADPVAGSGGFVVDSVAGSGGFAADSVAGAAAGQGDALSQLAVSAGEMFGPDSFAPYGAAEQLSAAAGEAPGLAYQLMVFGLALFYFFVIMTQRAEIVQSLGMLFGKRHEERDADNYSYVYNRTMRLLVVMAAFTYGIAVSRIIHATGIAPTAYSSWSSPLVVVAAAAIVFILGELQQLALKAAGALTFENNFVASLITLRRVFAAMTGLTITPVVFLFALTGESWAFAGLCIALIILSLFMAGYLYYSFKLFMSEKVSILVWFLYLCAVEVVPYGILILGILRTA